MSTNLQQILQSFYETDCKKFLLSVGFLLKSQFGDFNKNPEHDLFIALLNDYAIVDK